MTTTEEIFLILMIAYALIAIIIIYFLITQKND